MSAYEALVTGRPMDDMEFVFFVIVSIALLLWLTDEGDGT